MSESAYRFGDFRLVPARRQLWRADRQVSIQPKVFDTLVYLIQHRDRAVGRDELVAAVWGRTDLSDNIVCQIIGRARQLVGDSGEAQHSIQTVPRFGYHWVRDVDVLAPPSDLPEHADADVPALPTRSFLSPARWRGAMAALSLLCAVGLVASASNGTSTVARDAQSAAETMDGRLATLRAALQHGELDRARATFRTFSDPERARPDVRFEAAELAAREGRSADALKVYVALMTEVGASNPLLAAKAAAGAGWMEFSQGSDHFAQAQRHYEQAIDGLQSVAGDDAQRTLGRVWSRLGGLHTKRLAFDEAERAYAQARTALEGLGDTDALCGLENNVGLLLQYQYRLAEALPRFQRAAELCQEAGFVTGEVGARTNLVNLQFVMLQPAETLVSEPRLRVLRDQLGDPVEAGFLDVIRAHVLIMNGRLHEAEVVLRAFNGGPAPGDAELAVLRQLVQSQLAFGRANWTEGADLIRKALDSEWSSPGNGLVAMARWQLVEALRAQGDVHGMVEAADAFEAQGGAKPDAPDIRLYAALARGEAAAARGDGARARAGFEQALAQAEQNHAPSELVQVATAYTRFLLRRDPTAARAMADRLDDWAGRDYAASLVQLRVYHAIDAQAWQTTLDRTRQLAGERVIPPELTVAPSSHQVPFDRLVWADQGP